jgi:hypothetical protein
MNFRVTRHLRGGYLAGSRPEALPHANATRSHRAFAVAGGKLSRRFDEAHQGAPRRRRAAWRAAAGAGTRRFTIAELEKYLRQQDRETKRLGTLVHINDLLVGPIKFCARGAGKMNNSTFIPSATVHFRQHYDPERRIWRIP